MERFTGFIIIIYHLNCFTDLGLRKCFCNNIREEKRQKTTSSEWEEEEELECDLPRKKKRRALPRSLCGTVVVEVIILSLSR